MEENGRMNDLKRNIEGPSVARYMALKEEGKKLQKEISSYKRKISVALVCSDG